MRGPDPSCELRKTPMARPRSWEAALADLVDIGDDQIVVLGSLITGLPGNPRMGK